MLTNRELAVLLLLTQCRKVLIIMPTDKQTKDMQEFLRAQIRAEYPTFCNSYTVTGMVVHIRGHENVTVATPEDWRTYNKCVFNGVVLVDDDMSPDDYAPLPYITESPEKLHKYLGERII